jgi:hypothetical protein
MASRTGDRSTMALIHKFGEMWARNAKNIKDVREISKGRQGVYILYNGSTPVYVGKGYIRSRLRDAETSERRGKSWDYFSWYILRTGTWYTTWSVAASILPPYLRYMTHQAENSRAHLPDRPKTKKTEPIYIRRTMTAGGWCAVFVWDQ